MSIDECCYWLHRAGWSIGDICFQHADGPEWVVSGTNGENVIDARHQKQGAAWMIAVAQARACGMFGRAEKRDPAAP